MVLGEIYGKKYTQAFMSDISAMALKAKDH
jgi:hypothetical protein